MKKSHALVIGGLASLVSVIFLQAAEYLGADAFLRKLQEAQSPGADGENPVKKLQEDVTAYAQVSATLPPEEAAQRWLELADQLGKMTPSQFSEDNGNRSYNQQLSFGGIMQVIPPPAAWDALAKLVDARTATGQAEDLKSLYVRLMAHWLTNDESAQKADLAAVSVATGKLSPGRAEYQDEQNFSLRMATLADTTHPEEIVQTLEEKLRAFQRGTILRRNTDTRTFEVPDLVPLVGAESTAAFLRRALAVDHLVLSINSGSETEKLARQVALEMSPRLKTPQWGLAQALDVGALYDEMTRRFPESKTGKGSDSDRRRAKSYRMGALLIAGKKAEAIRWGLRLGSDEDFPDAIREELARKGRLPELADFFGDLLRANPDLPYWENYVQVAVQTAQSAPMLALAETTAARKGLAAKPKLEIQKRLRKAYLAADQEEKGLVAFRQEMKLAADPAAEESSLELTDALEFARLGKLLGRADVVEEGLAAVRRLLHEANGVNARGNRAIYLEKLAELLSQLDRGAEAEAALLDALSTVRPQDTSTARNLLLKLVSLYHQAGRSADVITLLDRARQWNAGDLADIYDENVTTAENSDPLGYFAAAALSAQNKTAEARVILQAVLDKNGGYDPAYELLVKLDPAGAMTHLDALFARDPYEERPLIWKAQLLLDAGELEKAEATARQAIAIDPSDGEQGPGRRMRVYSVLADIREARGYLAEAKILRGAVTAIRHSEAADRFYEAGLTTRSVKMYEEALTHFADAYCIQSRLALRKMELGDAAGAEEHYRRAYELMPQSFGRVESHCFGCEQAFAGEHPQSVAEKVFTQIAAKMPENPQVHYLLGYLRDEQNRPEAALPEYRAAVKLDAKYLNAWSKLESVAGKLHLPAAERNAIQLQMLKLDPLQRHIQFDVSKVTDHRAAWLALAEAAQHRSAEPEQLYPLPESAKTLAKTDGANNRSENERPKTPSQALAEASFLEDLDRAFGMAMELEN